MSQSNQIPRQDPTIRAGAPRAQGHENIKGYRFRDLVTRLRSLQARALYACKLCNDRGHFCRCILLERNVADSPSLSHRENILCNSIHAAHLEVRPCENNFRRNPKTTGDIRSN